MDTPPDLGGLSDQEPRDPIQQLTEYEQEVSSLTDVPSGKDIPDADVE